MSILKNPLKQPVTRDTTVNDAGDILRRLALLGLWLCPALALVFAVLALARRDEGLMRGAWISASLFLALFATRRWWRANSETAKHPEAGADALVPAPIAPATAAVAQDRPRVLLIDASLNGPGGNSAALLDAFQARLGAQAVVERVALSGPEAKTFASLEPALRAADAFVFATGTHWDSWSSALQKFLEDATPAEASDLWLGKPAAVLVTEHSVGGKAVLSRLQGVLLTLGCALPPLSGLVLSKAVQLARDHAPDSAATEDFWSPEDLDVVAHNLIASLRGPRPAWRAWPVDRRHFHERWLRTGRD